MFVRWYSIMNTQQRSMLHIMTQTHMCRILTAFGMVLKILAKSPTAVGIDQGLKYSNRQGTVAHSTQHPGQRGNLHISQTIVKQLVRVTKVITGLLG